MTFAPLLASEHLHWEAAQLIGENRALARFVANHSARGK